jgi:hypothetical protein
VNSNPAHGEVYSVKHIIKLWVREYGVREYGVNTVFNNISAISWRSVLFVEKTGESGETHPTDVSH